jgi:hypothetical protein
MIDRRYFLTSLAGGVLGLACRHDAPVADRRGPAARQVFVPEIAGDFWTIAGNPDLGRLADPGQQPVDFGIWQAADGTWQLWSCIRSTKVGGKTRLFYRWEGRRLTDVDWEPMGIALEADPRVGETPGGLQAPFVLKTGATYTMLYGDWQHICLATSVDGRSFARRLTSTGQSGLFSSAPDANTRDPMLLAHARHYYCYTTAHPSGHGAVYCRVSSDLRSWGESTIVSAGGACGSGPSSAECPFVVHHHESGTFSLFRTQRYGADAHSCVYESGDPLNFGVDDDRGLVATIPVAAPEIVEHDRRLFLACLRPALDGIQIAPFRWTRRVV